MSFVCLAFPSELADNLTEYMCVMQDEDMKFPWQFRVHIE